MDETKTSHVPPSRALLSALALALLLGGAEAPARLVEIRRTVEVVDRFWTTAKRYALAGDEMQRLETTHKERGKALGHPPDDRAVNRG